MYSIWSMILQTSQESLIPAFSCHCMYTEKRTFWRKYLPIDIYAVKGALAIPLTGSCSVLPHLRDFGACSNCVPSIVHPALPGALLYIQACFLMLQGEIYSTFIQFFIYLANTNVDGECRKDWQMGMILQTKLQFMGQNQHTEGTKWDDVCESAYKLRHTNNCSEDRAGETSEMQMQILASTLQWSHCISVRWGRFGWRTFQEKPGVWLGCWKNLGNLQLQVGRSHLAAVFISRSRVLRAMGKLNPSPLTEEGDHVNKLETLSHEEWLNEMEINNSSNIWREKSWSMKEQNMPGLEVI